MNAIFLPFRLPPSCFLTKSTAAAPCDQYVAAIGKMYGYRLPSAAAAFPKPGEVPGKAARSEEHTSELQSQSNLVCRLLLEKKKNDTDPIVNSTISQCTPTLISYGSEL